MPPRYFFDSVASSESKGKILKDTVWHKVTGPGFQNQMGDSVRMSDIHNKVIVLNFFFSRCPSICPGLTKNMKRLQDSFKNSDSIIQFISISVDPLHDSVPVMRKYADRFAVNHDNWWFLTGDKKQLYEFSMSEVKAGIADTKVDSTFIHTENFFLLDTNHVIRGWYNGFDEKKLAQLAKDIPLLMLEKDKTSPSIFRRFIPILPLIFIGIAIVFVVTILLQRNRNKFSKTYDSDGADIEKER
jgi:protein SCO1/2